MNSYGGTDLKKIEDGTLSVDLSAMLYSKTGRDLQRLQQTDRSKGNNSACLT